MAVAEPSPEDRVQGPFMRYGTRASAQRLGGDAKLSYELLEVHGGAGQFLG
jgi:hypothetical protein